MTLHLSVILTPLCAWAVGHTWVLFVVSPEKDEWDVRECPAVLCVWNLTKPDTFSVACARHDLWLELEIVCWGATHKRAGLHVGHRGIDTLNLQSLMDLCTTNCSFKTGYLLQLLHLGDDQTQIDTFFSIQQLYVRPYPCPHRHAAITTPASTQR